MLHFVHSVSLYSRKHAYYLLCARFSRPTIIHRSPSRQITNPPCCPEPAPQQRKLASQSVPVEEGVQSSQQAAAENVQAKVSAAYAATDGNTAETSTSAAAGD